MKYECKKTDSCLVALDILTERSVSNETLRCWTGLW